MPIMGGIEATKFLIQEMIKLNLSYFPIIGCTAHGDAESIEYCKQTGMLHVVVKPVFIKTLREIFNLISDDPEKNLIIMLDLCNFREKNRVFKYNN